MRKGRIRNIFPGSNTCKGFYSFYDYFVRDDSYKVFYLKGGPGIGKSVFIRNIGNEIANRGLDIEFLYCSADCNSLDGVYVPLLDLAIIDGTPPHLMDPKNPGAVDEIIHLGECWNEAGLRKNREEIISINREVKRLFRKSFFYLKTAKLFLDEVESYVLDTGALDIMGLNEEARGLIKYVFNDEIERKEGGKKRVRHFYAAAITPQGVCSFLENLFDPLERRIVIKGRPGTGKNTIVRKIMEEGISRGLTMDICHCALDPDKYEHLIFPEIGVGVVTSMPPHEYEPKEGDIIVDTEKYLDLERLNKYHEEMEEALKKYDILFNNALSFLSKTKQVRDGLEKHYSSNTNFEMADEKRNEVLERIFKLLP